MVGSMFEPFSVEAINSSKYRDFIERSLAVDTFQPDRHIGLAMGAYGDDWTFKGGIFSTSFGDASLNPARGYPATWGIPRLYIPNAGGGASIPVQHDLVPSHRRRAVFRRDRPLDLCADPHRA